MGDRTVSVWLKAQVADYLAKMGQAAKVTSELDAAAVAAARALKKLSTDMSVVAGTVEPAMSKSGKGVEELGTQSDKTTASTKKLGDSTTTAAKGAKDLGEKATEADTATRKLGEDAEKTSGGLRRIGDSLGGARDTVRSFGQELDKAAKADKLDKLNNAALVTGGVLVAAFVAPVKAAADFDRAMSSVNAATHASVTDMQKLRSAALEAGAATIFSATEAARGITELSKAGVSTADILSGGLRGALDLAAAGELGVGDAAEVAATAMTQFHLSGRQIPHLADLIAAGAGKAQGEVSDMAYALKMGGLVAAQFGISVDDTVATLASFASAGLIGSDAGTSFKSMLLHLAAPSAQSAALMKRLGIEVYDASGQFVGMEKLAESLKVSLAGLSEEQRNQALATIFGSDAIRSANVLYNQGAQGIVDWRNKVNEAGYATDTANRKLDNLSGDLEKLKGSVETNLIKAGTGANEVLRNLAQGAEHVVDAIGQIPEPVMSVGVGLAGIAGAGLLVAGGLGTAVVKMHETRQALADIGEHGTRAEQVMVGFAKGAGKVAAALTATQVIGASFGDSINPQIASLARGMETWVKTGQAGGEAARLFGNDLENLKYDLDQLDNWDTGAAKIVEGLTGLGSLFDQSIVHATERLSAYDQALTAMVQGGKTEEAKAAFQKIADVAKEQGVNLDVVKAALPGYAAALEGASVAETDAIKKTQDHTKAQSALNVSLSAAITLYGGLQKALDAINGPARDYDRALNDAAAAVDDLGKSVEDNTATLDRNTPAGRANREAILKGTEAAEKAAQAVYDHNVAMLGEAEATRLASIEYERVIAALKAKLPITKENREEAEKLWAAVANHPPLVTASVKVDIPKTVMPELTEIDNKIKGLQNKQVKIDEQGAPDAEARIAKLNKQILDLQDRKVRIEEQGAGTAVAEVKALDVEIAGLEGRKVQVAEEGAADADVRVQHLQAAIDRLRDKKVHIEAQVNAQVYESRNYVNLDDFQNTHGNLRGGVYTHAQKGLVNAGVYPAGPTKYAFAEKATGGEIFAPKFGDINRTRSIVDYGVKNWWGGRVDWGDGGGSGGAARGGNTYNIYVTAGVTQVGSEVIARIKEYEQTNGSGWRA